MAGSQPRYRIGTSGWNYPHWRERFYPKAMPANRLLPYYCEHFNTVEINNSFYHLPSRQTIEQWREIVPAGFVFAVKASRYITHMKKLKDPTAGLSNFLPVVEGLGNRLGVVLFQLPPRWGFDEARFADFLAALPRKVRCAFEFRDASWQNDRCYALLERYNCAACIFELAGERSPFAVTADFVYVRLHGPSGAYEGNYSGQALRAWADRLKAWMEQGHDVYCYFDNDQNAYAVSNARKLLGMMA
jgi:uncharacterized protein YecE (DUF72 family)